MAKAVKNFYWGGKWYKVGDDAPDDAPKFVIDGEPAPQKEVVTKTVKTGSKVPTPEVKDGAPETEDKNGAPKTANKRRKKSK